MLDARRVEGEVGERWKSKFKGGERRRRGLRRGRRQGRRRGLRRHGCRGLHRGRCRGLRRRVVVVRVEEIDVRREDDVHLFFQLPFLGTVVVSSHPPPAK